MRILSIRVWGVVTLIGYLVHYTSAASALGDKNQLRIREQASAREEYWARRRGLQFGMPRHAYVAALAPVRAQVLASARAPAALPPFSWEFIGPQPTLKNLANFGGAIAGQPLPNSGGRISAVVVDDRPEANSILVGAAGGGLWVSHDGSSFEPLFDSAPVFDTNHTILSTFVPTQAIGSIALDPSTTPSTLYIGTGEGNGSDSYYGHGIFRSSDFGHTWTQLGNAAFGQRAVASIAIDHAHSPPVIFAGIAQASTLNRVDAPLNPSDQPNTGLWRSDNSGVTWKQYLATTFDNCTLIDTNGPCPILEIKLNRRSPGTIFVAVQYDTVFRSKNGGDTWEPMRFPGVEEGIDVQGRQSIEVSPNPPPLGTIYVMVGNSAGSGYLGFFRSIDNGNTWTRQTVPSASLESVTIDGSDVDGGFSQSSYDQTLLVDPTDSNGQTVFFGGVGLYVSNDGGSTWRFVASQGGTHADQHALAYDEKHRRVLVGNDGGLYAFDLASNTFVGLNSTISSAQLQSVGPHPTDSDRLLAGLQDNGTQLYTGQPPWDAVDTGDGGVVLFDHADPTFAYHTYATVYGGALPGPMVSRSTDGGNTWAIDPATTNLIVTLDNEATLANFYPPIAVDPDVPHRVFFGAQHIYVSNDGMLTWQKQEDDDLTSGCGTASCALQDIAFSQVDHRVAYALSQQVVISGGQGKQIYGFRIHKCEHADTNEHAIWVDLTANLEHGFPNGKRATSTQATSVVFDPHNAANVFITLSGFTTATGVGHIYSTVDSGNTWVRRDGFGGPSPLPDVPVLRLAVAKNDATGNTLFAATDVGIFRSENLGTTWREFNLKTVPPVPIFDIQQNDSGTLFIGSHGRGAYRLVVH